MEKFSNCFTHPPRNDGSLNFLRNWTKTLFWWLIFPNFANIKHLVSLSCIIWANVSYLVEYSSYEKAACTITDSSNKQLLKFWLFNCSNFETTFVKNFIEKPPGFKIYFERTDKVSPLRQYLWSEFSRQWNNDPLIVTWNSHGRAFYFLNFVKWRKY